MALTAALIRWLQTEEAAAWLAPLTAAPPDDAHLLSVLTRLRQELPPEQASALVTTARLRQRGQVKFPGWAERMFFCKEALEQASAQAVARHTAQRFRHFSWVVDLGCGLGGDALALAEQGARVLAVDRDPLRLALVEANARALGWRQRVSPLQADIRSPAWRAPAAWADPGRRTASRRVFHPDQLQPPLSVLLALRDRGAPHMGVKLMPGLPHDAIPPEAEAEWISLHGELKEVVLWFGELARGRVRRGTLLPAGVALTAAGAKARVAAPGSFLYEPDPAVIRAGAVGDLAQMLGLWQFDATIAYLSNDTHVATPFARCWRILEHLPFDLKALNRRLRSLDGYVVAVKKRGSPVDPEAFRRRLYASTSGRPLIVVLTRVQDRPWTLICEAPAQGRPERTPVVASAPH